MRRFLSSWVGASEGALLPQTGDRQVTVTCLSPEVRVEDALGSAAAARLQATMARVLVPDGASYAVISALRALTRCGDECEVAHDTRRRRGRSAYVRDVHLIPAASRGDERFVRALVALVRSRQFDVLLPVSSDAVYAISKHSAAFPTGGPGFVVPPLDSFLVAHDKRRLAALCERLDIPVPRTFPVEEDRLVDVAGEVRFPVVVKPRQSVGGGRGVRFASTKSELLRAFDEVRGVQAASELEDFERPLVQEYIRGAVHDACALALEGKVVNVLTQCRVLMLPVSGGVGAVAVTTRNRTVQELARRLLEELEWHGAANVEFKYDARDGRYKILEVNPRFWGTLDLAIRVGMDFPGMVRDYVLGLPVRRGIAYPEGVRYRYLLPRAILAYIQLVRETGIDGIRDPHRYERTLYDFDPADWAYELLRVYQAVKAVARREYRAGSGIPRSYLVTPARAAWEEQAA
jgi:predicted ATP-grasp superfamily ATP-dependent carboligase